MATFGIITEENELVDKFMEDTFKRYEMTSQVIFKFKKFVFKDGEKIKSFYAIHMKLLIFNIFLYFWFMFLFILVFQTINNNINAWVIAPVLVACLGLIWTKWCFYPMLKKGMRKVGYKGSIKLVNSDFIMEKIYFEEAQ